MRSYRTFPLTYILISRLQIHPQTFHHLAGLTARVGHIQTTSQQYRHATMSMHLRLSEETKLRIRQLQHFIQITQRQVVAIAFHDDRPRGARTMERDIGDRQTQHGTRVQRELRLILRDHRHHTGIMRTGRHLAKDNLVALHEQLDTKDTPAS